ncbi:5'/3'-nucleotidase SurE [Phormidium tenue FACHB-886]|nr:5'/3'-nucleotidase SurE [Phormidium tenue FACHB-886]
MTLVLTNDDGIDAPGLRSLQRAVFAIGLEHSAIVAPKLHHSGCGHQVTTTRPITVETRSANEIAIGGTPADCTRIALSHLFPGEIEWVFSGVNAGGNLGADVYISGTVAAVREAAFHRIPGIAISQRIQGRRAIDWEMATQLTVRVLDKLLSLPLEPGHYWNVNLPHLDSNSPAPDLVFCSPCSQPLPAVYRVEAEGLHYAGDYGKRDRDPGSDVAVCFAGHIAVTQLQV